MAFSSIQPYQYAALRVTNDYVYIEQLKPNGLINFGKYGSFHTNQIFGRPYHLTFEILDKSEQTDDRELRIVPTAELHAAALLEEAEAELDDVSTSVDGGTPVAEIDDESVQAILQKSNQSINDDPSVQKLTMAEIEALKHGHLGNAKALIEKIMKSHSTLDQKTAFSLAKYTLRKQKKYLKRFTVLPLDVVTLTDWFMIQRDFSKVLEIRNETLGLIGCWANVHHSGNVPDLQPSGRYLVVDDTGGLIVAAMAERMGILHQDNLSTRPTATEDEEAALDNHPTAHSEYPQHSTFSPSPFLSNTITLIHSNQQPNLSLLRYFNYDHNTPTLTHTLTSSLRSLTYLQLLNPHLDNSYIEPSTLTPSELSLLKSNRRATYHRKRRRWQRIKETIDTTRAGNFDGLVVASHTEPIGILRHLLPLLRGGAQVVVYSPHIEPLQHLTDAYSTAKRTAWLNTPPDQRVVPSKDFPVDPSLLLSPTVQMSRVRKWQVLRGRTHPVMTSRGGADGWVFVGTRVLPVQGVVEARGRPGRRKKGVVEVEVSVAGGKMEGGDGIEGETEMGVNGTVGAEVDKGDEGHPAKGSGKHAHEAADGYRDEILKKQRLEAGETGAGVEADCAAAEFS